MDPEYFMTYLDGRQYQVYLKYLDDEKKKKNIKTVSSTSEDYLDEDFTHYYQNYFDTKNPEVCVDDDVPEYPDI